MSTRETMNNVGVIGLGVIGKPIALRLLKGEFKVAVFDVRPEPVAELKEAGATACTSSADVAARSDIIISLVHDAAQTDDVVFGAKGIIGVLKPGTIFATGSTLGPEPVQRIAAALAVKGCGTLDMPITGGYIAAYEGKLVLMIGGDETTLARALPAFYSFAHIITHAGDVGAGQTAKLAHQLVMAMNVMALLEGLALGAAGGVEPAILKQILKDGLANSTVLQVWNELGSRWKDMLKPAAPDAELPNLRKDLHTALELARELGVELHVGTHASRIADSGVATGHDNPLL
jgi:2-hydroxy-3-oxopropionate reductase